MKNIRWEPGLVSSEARRANIKQKGIVVWFTGLSGSGKTTIANGVEKALVDLGHVVCKLDGDNIRHGLNSDLGFSVEDRDENIRRLAEVAKLLVDSEIITLVSAITPYENMRLNARKIIGSDQFVQVYVKASIDLCKKRDVKGLYKLSKDGVIENLTGVSAPFEEPHNSECMINTQEMSIDNAIEVVVQYILKQIEDY